MGEMELPPVYERFSVILLTGRGKIQYFANENLLGFEGKYCEEEISISN